MSDVKLEQDTDLDCALCHHPFSEHIMSGSGAWGDDANFNCRVEGCDCENPVSVEFK